MTTQTLKPTLYRDIENILWPIMGVPHLLPYPFSDVDLFYAHYMSSTQPIVPPQKASDDIIYSPTLKHTQTLGPLWLKDYDFITNATVQG